MRSILIMLTVILLTGCQSSTMKIRDDVSNKTHKVYLTVDENKKRETVLILHSCAGLTTHISRWAEQIAKWNYNAVVLDSFYPYGFTNLCHGRGTDAMMFAYNSSKDAEFVGKWIKEQSWSNGKVSVIGFSAGANTGMLISTTPNTFKPSNVFTSVVAYYPNCFQGYQERNLTTPLLIHVGEKDNWVNVGECKDMAKKPKFKDAEFQFYPAAEHSWDVGTTGVAKCWLGTCSWSYHGPSDKQSRQLTKEFFEKKFNQ